MKKTGTLTRIQAKRLENSGDQQALEQSPIDVKQEIPHAATCADIYQAKTSMDLDQPPGLLLL